MFPGSRRPVPLPDPHPLQVRQRSRGRQVGRTRDRLHPVHTARRNCRAQRERSEGTSLRQSARTQGDHGYGRVFACRKSQYYLNICYPISLWKIKYIMKRKFVAIHTNAVCFTCYFIFILKVIPQFGLFANFRSVI